MKLLQVYRQQREIKRHGKVAGETEHMHLAETERHSYLPLQVFSNNEIKIKCFIIFVQDQKDMKILGRFSQHV